MTPQKPTSHARVSVAVNQKKSLLLANSKRREARGCEAEKKNWNCTIHEGDQVGQVHGADQRKVSHVIGEEHLLLVGS